MTDITKTLDASGLSCPMPVVKTKLEMNKLAPGEVLEVLSTDRGSLSDIPAWAEGTGNRLIATEERDGSFRFLIEKA